MKRFEVIEKLQEGARGGVLPFYNLEYAKLQDERELFGFRDSFKEVNYSKGYTVSVGIQRVVNLEFDEFGLIFKEFEKLTSHLLQATGEIIASDYKLTLGFWINDNKLYIDINKIYDNLDEALKVAKNNKQLAIYDNKNNKEITL